MELKIKIFTTEIDGSTTLNVYATSDGSMVGSLKASEWEKRGGWISHVFVHEEYRRCGIAEGMLTTLFKKAIADKKEGLGLSVRKGNTAAILYAKLGFQACYESGNDVVMTKHFE